MDYEKEYKGALERCKWLLSIGMISEIAATDMFRELIDNKSENVRKEIINIFHSLADGKIPVPINFADIFTWLGRQAAPQMAEDAFLKGCNDTKKSLFEKQGEQKPAWSEKDECYMSECIGAIATKDGWSFEEKRKTKHWLESLKQTIGWKPSDEQITVLELASKYERVFTPKQISVLIDLKEQLKKLKGE